MNEQKQNRSRIVGLRFTQGEFELLNKQCLQTTTPRISEFIRKVLFEKPITVKQRNQSLDDFMTEMIQLRAELNHVGNNFNQAVKKLHTLIQVAEFRGWITTYDNDRLILLNKIETIENKISSISDKWLQ